MLTIVNIIIIIFVYHFLFLSHPFFWQCFG